MRLVLFTKYFQIFDLMDWKTDCKKGVTIENEKHFSV